MILESHPEIKKLQGYDSSIIWKMIFIPSLFWTATYFAAALNILELTLCAATIGAFCKMNIFNIMHELTHDLVHPAIKSKLKTSLMLIIQMPMAGSNFPYYKWFHRSHHTMLGTLSLEEARSKAYDYSHTDGDLLTYTILASRHRHTDLKPRANIWLTTPLGRLLWFGVYTPIMRLLAEMLVIIIVSFSRIPKLLRTGLKNDWLSLLDKLLVISSLSLIFMFWGWQSLYFIVVSQLFYLGFLFHPCLAFWVSVHKSHNSAADCQPTSSVYGTVMAVFCGGCNYHTEHHDFVNIPVSRLKRVHALSSPFYTEIKHFNSFSKVYQAILTSKDTEWVYGCQK